LSPTSSLKEAAINLFAALRQADKSEMEYIIAEEVPNIGLGRAINDRLKRAAG
jgi:L-threonylcarbamoyladenylate synthase